MAAQLLFTDEQRAEFKRRFEQKDKNGDNSVTAEELGEVMKSFGKDFTPEQLQKMISDVDTDKSGTIEFSEMLMGIAEKMMKWTWKESHYTKCFNDMDKDGNGFLCDAELRQAMSKIEPPMTEEEIDEMIKKVDHNKDGKVDLEEFVKMIKSS